MKRYILPVVAVLSLVGGPMLAASTVAKAAVKTAASTAANPCSTNIALFDVAAKTTQATKADVAKAMKLRNRGAKLCAKKTGLKKGEADIASAVALVRAKG